MILLMMEHPEKYRGDPCYPVFESWRPGFQLPISLLRNMKKTAPRIHKAAHR